MLVPGTSRSAAARPGRVSLSKPNWEGTPVMRMLVAAAPVALLTRIRQSAVRPSFSAVSPTRQRSP